MQGTVREYIAAVRSSPSPKIVIASRLARWHEAQINLPRARFSDSFGLLRDAYRSSTQLEFEEQAL